jgi:hypothetical protein
MLGRIALLSPDHRSLPLLHLQWETAVSDAKWTGQLSYDATNPFPQLHYMERNRV